MKSPPIKGRRRGTQVSSDQLSFFDASGELLTLQDEAHRLAVAKEHQAFLQEALERTRATLDDLEAQRAISGGNAAKLGGLTGEVASNPADRRAAGETIQAQLLAVTPDGEGSLIALGELAGLTMQAMVHVRRDGLIALPRLAGDGGKIYEAQSLGREFVVTAKTDPEQTFARFEALLQEVAREHDILEAAIARTGAELASFEHQLGAIPPPSVAQIDDVNATSHESAALASPAATNQEEKDDGRQEATLTGNLRRAAQGLSGDEPSGGLRAPGANGRVGRLSADARGTSGGLLPDADGADAIPSRGDRQPARETRLSGASSVPGERDRSDRHRLRQAVEEEEARRQERARLNFRITPEDRIGAGTPKEKVAANIEAIRLLKRLEEEQRTATEAERQVLVKYVGWGAFAQAIFDGNPHSQAAKTWKAERQALADLLSTDEWAAARASTLNAHYTSEAVIGGIWQALAHLGFDGGRVLEPAAGIGHFIGLAPEPMRDRIAWTGVELDPLSGGIAAALYPGSDMRIQGFETVNWPDGFFDMAISNVPFGDYSLRDARYRPMSIHDYFFVRSLDKVRTGGIVAFITSRYTLDKENDTARREIAKRAHFLGAIRLPGGEGGAFARNAGTEVTTDILFLRKRGSMVDAVENTAWLTLSDADTPDGPVRINSYFAQNAQMMLGEMRLQRSMYSATDPVLVGRLENLEQSIAAAAQHMTANAFIPRGTATPDDAVATVEADTATDGVKEGAFYRRDGQVYRKILGVGQLQIPSRAETEKLVALIALRDVVNELLAQQARGASGDRSGLRDRLNLTYDAFVRRFGPINKTLTTVTARTRGDGSPVTLRKFPNLAAFREDPDAFKVAALENYDEASDRATKTAIFSHDIVQPYVAPEVTGPADALAVSLNERGKVDIALIAEHLDVSEREAVEALGDQIWLDPAGDVWRTVEDYLSGDVVGKLEDARAAASSDERYERNVTALEEVQPAPLTRVDIKVPFGAPWVPSAVYRDFFGQALNIAAGDLTLNPVTKKWQFLTRPAIPESATAQYATARASVFDIIQAAINNTEIRVMDDSPEPGGSASYNPNASEEANAKVAAIREAFSGAPESGIEGWVWQDDARASELETLYNHKFNRLVPTLYDGAHQTMPGIVRYVTVDDGTIVPFELHPHQLNAVWRVVSSGNTLLDHAVGAGKTFAMLAAGMEQKRLGLIQRPMYVVPNHMLEQFSREFLQAYPQAKLLVADKTAMTRAKRREFAARVAAERWDGIIITHDAFGRIKMSDAAYERFIRSELDELSEFRERAAAEEGKNSPTVKELEKAGKRLEARLGELLKVEKKDDGITFEELAVDFLFIDEAHAFKNLSFRTRHNRVKGLSAQNVSQRATDLFLKIRYLDEKRPGRSVVFATGTPVSNTIAEMYTMQRYLQMELLKTYGIEEFDAWAATFGEIVTQVELAPSGKGFRTTRSFSKFVNIPELMALYSRVADTQTADMLNLPRPRLKGGAIQVVEAGMSEREAAYMEALVARAEAIKGKRSEKGGDNMLKIMSEGLQLATDFRLLDPGASPNPEGKLAKAALNIVRIWENGEEPGLAQIVFLDMGVPGSKAKARQGVASVESAPADDIVIVPETTGEDESDNALVTGRFNLYGELRAELMARGIPKAEIAFIHDADNDEKKARLFAAVRAGEVRVLIGSTAKMGVGTNVQKRLVAMHHLDAPWRPADVEQRDGRILRQGNLNEAVEIYRYITLRSLDAYRWQTLNTKANFIAQLRAGARGVRTAEDIDSPLPEAAMLKAAATGDPRIMEHAELGKTVQLLESARRGHERSVGAARRAIIVTNDKIARLTASVEKARADAAGLVDLSGDRFAVTLTMSGESVTLRERRVAGEVVKTHLLRSGARHWDNAPAYEILGMLSGLQIRAAFRRVTGDLQLSVLADGRMSYGRGDYFALTEDTDAVGLMRRFESLIKAIPQVLKGQEDELARAAADLPRLEQQLMQPAFAKQDQLDAGKVRLAELEVELRVQDQKGNTPMTQELRDEEWERLAPAAQQAVEAVIAEATSTEAHATRAFENGDVYAYPYTGGIAWGINGGEHGFNIARGTRGRVAEIATGGPAETLAIGDQQNGWNGGAVLHGAEKDYLDALHASRGDEAAFHHVFSKLENDNAIDTPLVTAIARAFTGEGGSWASRGEALGAIETKFYERSQALRTPTEPGRTVSFGTGGR